MHQQRYPNADFNRSQRGRMQHFQPNINFRGRGPRYRHHPKHHGAPPVPNQMEEHWCETCDRRFRTLDMLESHTQQHQMCKIDGCQFIAHPKVITMHIQMQHSSGLFKKIANLTNPEDIQKWREERKKKYPTKQNVEKKAAELKEKIERGEKMGLKRDRRKNDCAQKRKNSNSYEKEIYKRKKPTSNTKSCIVKKNIQKQEIMPPPENIRKLKPFAGILDLAIDNVSMIIQEEDQHCNYEIEDDDDNCVAGIKLENASCINEEPKTKVCGALSSLICEYGSTDEEVDKLKGQQSFSEKKKDIKDNSKDNQTENYQTYKKIQDEESENNSVRAKKCESDNDCPPEEVKVERAEEVNDKEEFCRKSEKTKKHKNINVQRHTVKKPNIKLPSTLLHKLLHKEIQQERNIVLQCIRHIVKNNYFDD